MLPFDDSRRLTGPNLYFTSTGAVLEVVGAEADPRLLRGWRTRVERAFLRLGWPGGDNPASVRVRSHASGASLAIAAPFDQLFTATEVNEWALCATALELDPLRWAGIEAALRVAAANSTPTTPIAPVIDEGDAMARFEQLAGLEARPDLRSLVRSAGAHRVSHALDESLITLGSGAGGRTWPLASLPRDDEIPWAGLRDIPVAAVTGSNGKTTTVRLIAACAREHGWVGGFSCTDGLFIGGASVAAGDYSGPVGARTILRDPRVDAAVLETARGGILRRGIAFERADAAVVTNVSSDHFGEYGIDDLDGLADAKLTVAALVDREGLLVLNADDGLLVAKSQRLAERFGREPALGWFALDADHPALQRHRAGAGATCGVLSGHLVLHRQGVEHDLGPVSAMPLTVDGAAHYNVSNLAAAALAAAQMGIPASMISGAFRRFGADASDNPGRMMRFRRRGVQVLVDYAHNPESLRGILRIAQHLRGHGRVGMLLGHAGNRQDSDLQHVAATAAEFRPDLVVVKESEAHLRGRAPGEVPRIIRDELLRRGLPESAVPVRMSELEAVQCALDWAQPGDVLVLLVHSLAARNAVVDMLDGSPRSPAS